MGTLYENVFALCSEAGIKPGKMCNDTGISRGLITDLKMGRKNSITIDTAKKIADYFNVSVDQVLGATKKEKSPAPDGAELDAETIQLQEIWNSADQEERKALLAMAEMLKARRNK